MRDKNMLIIPFRGLPELVDWKSTVLVNTKRIRPSSVNRDVKEKSNYVNEVSVSCSSLKSEVMFGCEVEA